MLYDGLRMAYVAKGTMSMSELREALTTEERQLYPDLSSAGADATSVLAVRGSRVLSKGKQRSRTSGPLGSCCENGKMRRIHRNCPTNPIQHNFRRADHDASTIHGKMSYEDPKDTILAIAPGSEAKKKDKNAWIII